MNDRTVTRLIFIALAVLLLALAFLNVAHETQQRTCAADNQQLHTVLAHWGQTNASDLSRALTQLSNDSCRLEGR